MRRRFVSITILVLYSAALIRLLVFKIEYIRLGRLRFRLASEVGDANYLPFRSILAYLRGEPSWLIAMLNLVGNVALLAPVGFLLPLAAGRMTWPACFLLAAAAGLAVEGLQVLLQVGIFDIDDLLLNALGVVLGYGVFRLLARRAA